MSRRSEHARPGPRAGSAAGPGVVAATFAALMGLATAASAQNSSGWQVTAGQDLLSAGICLPGSIRQCVRLQCLTMEGGGIHWAIDAREPGYSAESTIVEWAIGSAVFRLDMNKAGPAEAGIQSYDAAYDQAGHQALLERLKGGNRLTVGSDQFRAFTVPLRGSGAALTKLLADCPLTGEVEITDDAAGDQIAEPFDAVLALARRQGCVATEEEIFEAITDAGFGVWDVNQFVVIGAEDGTLELIDRSGGVHTYRVTGCPAADDVLSVDPDATELSLTAGDLPEPVRAHIGEIATMCGDAFQTAGRHRNAILAEDIDGDGTYYFLLEDALFCPSEILTMCGASHCPHALFVSAEGAWRRFDFILQGYSEFSPEGFLFMCSTPARKAGVFMENGELVQRNCP